MIRRSQAVVAALCLLVSTESAVTAPIEASKPRDHGRAALRLPAGSRFKATLRDGRTVEGKLLSHTFLPRPEYLQRFSAWQDTAGGELGWIAPDSAVTIDRKKSGIVTAPFLGFGVEGLYVTAPTGAGMRWIADSDIKTIHSTGGAPTSVSLIDSLRAKGRLPRVDAVQVAGSYDTTLVAIDDIFLLDRHEEKLTRKLWVTGSILVLVAIIVSTVDDGRMFDWD